MYRKDAGGGSKQSILAVGPSRTPQAGQTWAPMLKLARRRRGILRSRTPSTGPFAGLCHDDGGRNSTALHALDLVNGLGIVHFCVKFDDSLEVVEFLVEARPAHR